MNQHEITIKKEDGESNRDFILLKYYAAEGLGRKLSNIAHKNNLSLRQIQRIAKDRNWIRRIEQFDIERFSHVQEDIYRKNFEDELEQMRSLSVTYNKMQNLNEVLSRKLDKIIEKETTNEDISGLKVLNQTILAISRIESYMAKLRKSMQLLDGNWKHYSKRLIEKDLQDIEYQDTEYQEEEVKEQKTDTKAEEMKEQKNATNSDIPDGNQPIAINSAHDKEIEELITTNSDISIDRRTVRNKDQPNKKIDFGIKSRNINPYSMRAY